MAAGSGTSSWVWSLLLGLAATLVILTGHLIGLDRKAELQSLDLRFRYCSKPAAADNIVHVDIDDPSLIEVGRWPWPRSILAGMIDCLDRCGARTVALDIILPHPQKVRYISEAASVYDVADALTVSEVPPIPVIDDVVLAEAIGGGGNVFLPMHIDFRTPDMTPLDAAIFDGFFSVGADVNLSRKAVAARLKLSLQQLETDWPDILKSYVRLYMQTALAADAKRSFARTLEHLRLPGNTDPATVMPMIRNAYLHQRAIGAMGRFELSHKGLDRRFRLLNGRLVPPLVTFANVADGSGFVTVEPDPDGVVRRIPLLGAAGDNKYPQFALSLAAESLDKAKCRITAADDSVDLGTADGVLRRIPVDRRGFMLINWASCRSMKHIPAAVVAGIWQQRQAIERNRRLARLTLLELAAGRSEKLENLFAQVDELHHKRLAAERIGYLARLYDPANVPAVSTAKAIKSDEARVEKQIDLAAAEFLSEVDEFYLATVPQDPKAKAQAQYDKMLALRNRLWQIEKENARKQKYIHTQTARLRERIAGKICIIGSTATGAADFVPTPVGDRTPGVQVHTAILDTILAGRFIYESPRWLGIVAIVVMGLAVSLLAAVLGVRGAALAAMTLALGYGGFNAWVVFGVWRVWLVMVAPMAAVVASFLVVTAYRQLVEERAKRQIRDLFSHALSPALVDELLDDPSLAELGGQQRRISCLFSDLAGFTPLSGRLGPQTTVRLLNHYFDSVTEVVQSRWGGYLNKFLGDGVFALFGAPVFQVDHPARAVRAAVDYQAAVANLHEQITRDFGEDVKLSVRIGVTTDTAMVGNCGSSQRMDYTAIGEVVNLASRLEAANKFFGTGILLDIRTRDEADCPEMLIRSLGVVRILGIAEPVKIWNVLGRVEDFADGRQQAVADFSEAMEHFARRDFARADKCLAGVLAAWPGDGPAKIYRDLCRADLSKPDATDWPADANTGDGTVEILLPGKI
jgi:class 3 adenylate cyclase